MSAAAAILASYRTPRAVMRRLLAEGVREDRALAALMAACALALLARGPGLARAAAADPSVPLEARIAGAVVGLIFLAPLAVYALAAASHLAARIFGGRGSFGAARMALFWSLLATAPLGLLHGLAAGIWGEAALRWPGLGVLAVFLAIWSLSLAEAEWPPTSDRAEPC